MISLAKSAIYQIMQYSLRKIFSAFGPISNAGSERSEKLENCKVHSANLKIESIGKGAYPLFSFLEVRFFWNSPNRKAMPMLVGIPVWLAPLIAVPYMLAALVYNFGGAKYFIREKNEVVGTLILKVHQDALILHSLSVSPFKRKRGVGFLVLVKMEKLAKRMKLPWLELDVLKGNVPAQRLYWKFGFRFYSEKAMTLVLRKQVLDSPV